MTCVWEPDPGCLGSGWSDLDDAEKQRSLLLATSSLQALTLNRVGTCPITVRPCSAPRPCGCVWEPYLLLGRYLNPCGCKTARWCAPLSEVDLDGPVGYIDSLKINGVEMDLDSGDWRLDNGHLLVWQGIGPSPIPAVQDLDKPDTEFGTWSITYSQSYPVLTDGRMAVAYLAAEFAQACKPKGKCSLPRGVTSVVRNGVSFTVQAGLFPNGLTGIDIVDQFILKWAPAGAPTQTAKVFDIRKVQARRTNSLPRRVTETQITATTPLLVRKGTTFAHGWRMIYNGAPIDGTWSAQGQVRAAVGSPTVLLDLHPSVSPDGAVIVALTPAESSALNWTEGVYGIEVSKGGVTLRVAQGPIETSAEVVV